MKKSARELADKDYDTLRTLLFRLFNDRRSSDQIGYVNALVEQIVEVVRDAGL